MRSPMNTVWMLTTLFYFLTQGPPPERPEFPLEKGTYWVYGGNVAWTAPKSTIVQRQSVKWRMEVADVISRDMLVMAVLKGYPRDLLGFDPKKEPGVYVIIQVSGRKHYLLAGERAKAALKRIKDPSDLLVDLVQEDEVFLETPISFQGLKPGKYQVHVDLPGFLRDSRMVELNALTTVDITLKLAGISSGPGVSTSSEPGPPGTAPILLRYTNWLSDVPPWLAFVRMFKLSGSGPPVGWLPKQPTDIGRYNLEVVSAASVADAAAFYREVMKLHGLVIEDESPQTKTSYSLRARTKDRAHEVNLTVLRLSEGRDTVVQLTDSYTLPKN